MLLLVWSEERGSQRRGALDLNSDATHDACSVTQPCSAMKSPGTSLDTAREP